MLTNAIDCQLQRSSMARSAFLCLTVIAVGNADIGVLFEVLI
jgi:hypothetical protein